MFQASTVRATAAGRGRPRDRPGDRSGSYRLRRALLGATAVLLIGGGSAWAQQYGSVGASVTVDYGVLDSLGGPGGPNLPAMLSQGGYPQQSPYAASPYANPYAPVQSQLLAPPSTAPRSTLTTAPTGQLGAAPGQPGAAGGEVIRLIPPSQMKKSAPAVAAAPAPTPAPAPQPAAQPAATPPPPPTEIAETPAATPPAPPPPPEAPAPPAATAPAPAPAAPEPTQQATAAPPPPAPEPPAAPEPAPMAAAEPAPAPAPEPTPAPAAESSGMSAGGALTETGLAESGDAPEQSLAEAAPAASDSEPAPAASDSEPAAAAPTDSEAGAASPDAQTAALPPQSAVEGQVSIGFAEGASELTPEARSSLDVLAERLRGDESLRVQLLAYAVAIDDNTSRARRMSLSRALAVRAYLIEKGVRSTRMDVRALGSNVEGEPADKVDIIPQVQ